MHDIKNFVENTDCVKENLKKRDFDVSVVDEVLQLNESRKQLIQFVETRKAETKKLSKQIGPLKKAGEDASELMEKVAEIKKEIEDKDKDLSSILDKQNYLLSVIPNLLDDSVPYGKDEDDNVEMSKWGKLRKFDFEPKDHVELGENLGMLDFEAGAKLTGSRFVIYKSGLAKLERALINYMLDKHSDNGFEEIIPPFIVNAESMYGTGQLPKFADDCFKIQDDSREWYLIPTAEVPLTNIQRGELFGIKELPMMYAAYSPCFRSEAGSHGKDTRGLIRLHQFNKVEMVGIVHNKNSNDVHDSMVRSACEILEELELPYRAMLLCSGDISFGARKCVDLEVWLPGQQKYREISSISNFGEFQARRSSIRFRNEDGKPEFAHTLNGSGLAVGRTLVAILENYQQEDGSIVVPKVLEKYMGKITRISKK